MAATCVVHETEETLFTNQDQSPRDPPKIWEKRARSGFGRGFQIGGKTSIFPDFHSGNPWGQTIRYSRKQNSRIWQSYFAYHIRDFFFSLFLSLLPLLDTIHMDMATQRTMLIKCALGLVGLLFLTEMADTEPYYSNGGQARFPQFLLEESRPELFFNQLRRKGILVDGRSVQVEEKVLLFLDIVPAQSSFVNFDAKESYGASPLLFQPLATSNTS
ncbi:uncharacterized protein VP01_398g4 [Puccinia sorghi]|uniref:Uncharacterized protein n=1 Tax=Puccinia sorghi TaxID=27349 RepID=A0A0L6US46_9BASI|nr:uncharacterized protein VP01_398g4 [Puccinia sorghi]